MSKLISKAVPCVIQGDSLLCFEHPLAGWQVPKGTVEPSEAPTNAAVRELWEESGLSFKGTPKLFSVFDRPIEPDSTVYRWHLVWMPTQGHPKTWSHWAVGSPEEEGLCFRYFWLPLPAKPGHIKNFHPIFQEIIHHTQTRWMRGGSATTTT